MQCTRYVTKYPNKSAVLYNCIITQNRHSPNLTISGNYYFFCHQVSLVSLTELCTQNIPVLYTFAWFFRFFTIQTFEELVPNLTRDWVWYNSAPVWSKSGNFQSGGLSEAPGRTQTGSGPCPVSIRPVFVRNSDVFGLLWSGCNSPPLSRMTCFCRAENQLSLVAESFGAIFKSESITTSSVKERMK